MKFNLKLKNNTPFTQLIFTILLSYLIVVGIRLFLFDTLHTDGLDTPLFAPDPALYGFEAQQLSKGLTPPNLHLNSWLIYGLNQLGLPFDHILYFGPAFLSALVVIPIVLIFHLYGLNLIGGIASLIGGLGFGYYSRTYLGYFDTDVLNNFFMLMMLYGVMAVVYRRTLNPIIITFIAGILLLEWYHSAYPLILGIVGFSTLSLLVLGFKEERHYKAILLLGVLLLPFGIMVKIALFTLLFLIVFRLSLAYQYWIGLFIITGIGLLIVLDLSSLSVYLERYLTRTHTLSLNYSNEISYHFQAPMNLVSEAQNESLETVLTMMGGHPLFTIIGLIGLVLFTIAYPSVLFLWAMVLLGFSSLEMGVRFHIFATQTIAMGAVYALYSFTFLRPRFKWLTIIVGSFWMLLLTYQDLNRWNQRAKPSFTAHQVSVLKTIASHSTDQDFWITWWDYGWPLWYYTGMKTLIDNGKHHQDNWVIASVLLENSSLKAANIAHYFHEVHRKYGYSQTNAALHYGLMESKHYDLEKLLHTFESPTYDVPNNVKKYILLPYQMLTLFHTIDSFGSVDLKTGKPKAQRYYLHTEFSAEDERFITLKNGMRIDKYQGSITLNKRTDPIKEIINIHYPNGQKQITRHQGHPSGLTVIKDDQLFFIMEQSVRDSMWMRMWFLEDLNPERFKRIYSDKLLKVYEVK